MHKAKTSKEPVVTGSFDGSGDLIRTDDTPGMNYEWVFQCLFTALYAFARNAVTAGNSGLFRVHFFSYL